jgi:hypothetical protein
MLRGGQNLAREHGRSGMEEVENQAQKVADSRHMAEQAMDLREKRFACHAEGIARNITLIPDLNHENKSPAVIRSNISET